MVLKILKYIFPEWILNLKKKLYRIYINYEKLPSYEKCKTLMLNYQVKDLVNVDPISFKKKIKQFLNTYDYNMEDFDDPERQRDLSVKFRWGHNHDFGDFSLKGKLGNRHIYIPAVFADLFKVLPPSLDGLRILEIGAWTGGMSLLLCAMGAHVVAIEEVRKYYECLKYLKYAFNINNLEPLNLSLYECKALEFQDSFDIVLFTGVLYHVTDPILALRIIFNSLKENGILLLETMVTDSKDYILTYKSPIKVKKGKKQLLGRNGWNWFIPSPKTLYQMMRDVGFTNIRVSRIILGRCFAIGRRMTHVDFMRGGLSAKVR